MNVSRQVNFLPKGGLPRVLIAVGPGWGGSGVNLVTKIVKRGHK